MKTINHNLVTVLFTFKLGISLVKKTVCGMIIYGKPVYKYFYEYISLIMLLK